ncbi:uncharacterized protein LOC130713193 [Lotus japonicus]|uniref:uncharacterized protein LOC130713193 n=1 Tax=Lotus japonicus TaxID=34305 RepID=UPI00258A2691|nr:uncharacterized protein LOC130713193 [Lotus japonicus]
MAIKLDMNKAYDRMEWDFLEACLEAYGFNGKWIHRIMKCVKGASYRFKINGEMSTKIFVETPRHFEDEHLGLSPETITHAIFHCPWTRPVWFASQLQINHDSNNFQCFGDWILLMEDSLKNQADFHAMGLRIIALTTWAIWKERSECIFQGRPPNPCATVAKLSSSILEDYEGSIQVQDQASNAIRGQQSNRRSHWIAPPQGRVKINVDAAFNKTTCRGAVAAICRDETGAQLMSHSRGIHAPSPLVAEAIAIREALTLILNLGLDHAQVESDNKEIISLIKNGKSRWEISLILQDIHSLRSGAGGVNFIWTPREGNSHAHDLAQSKARSLIFVN